MKVISVTVLVVLSATFFVVGAGAASGKITMYYDDYFSDFDYETVEILDEGVPVSFKVGYGVEAGTMDDAVVTLKNGIIHATGIGTARVLLDGDVYQITVEAAPISMFLLIGQSNMYGNEGNEGQSIANENGTAYSTFGVSTVMTVENAAEFVPSALTGDGALINVQGNTVNLRDNPVNRLTQAGNGKIGLDSGFAYKWHEMTGDKVWLVNAAHGSTDIQKWVRGAREYNQAVEIFQNAQQTMRNEIMAGHYILKNYGYLWCQGCSDRANTAQYYHDSFISMYEG